MLIIKLMVIACLAMFVIAPVSENEDIIYISNNAFGEEKAA